MLDPSQPCVCLAGFWCVLRQWMIEHQLGQADYERRTEEGGCLMRPTLAAL